MSTFVMLTRMAPETLASPRTLETLERRAMDHIRADCPQVEWVHNYALLGPYDYLDIFNAPDVETATKVATIVRTFGHAHSEVFPATEWDKFKEIIHGLPGDGE